MSSRSLGRTPSEAIGAFQTSIQRFLSCVTRHVPIVRGVSPSNPEQLALLLGAQSLVRLAGPERIHLRTAHYFQVIEDHEGTNRWRVVIVGYAFVIGDADNREILTFHWHPGGRSPVDSPHLHIGAGAQAGYARLHRAHVPTGQVAINEVLRFAITDLGVEPLIDRDVALRVLASTSS